MLLPNRVAEAVEWRKYLHQHPELAFEEHETAHFVAGKLASFGINVSTGLGGAGVVGTFARGSSGRAIGIRADMDALPIAEMSDIPHKSRRADVMHACG